MNKKQPYKISILIPARNEMFLSRTVQDILENKTDDTEIIIGLDGQWADPAIPDHPDVTIFYAPGSIGQRAITKQCARLSKARYIIKTDSHCAFDKDFDKKMLEAFEKTGDNVTMVSIMRNLWAFDWVCVNGHRRYQGPSGPCTECGKETERDVCWIGKKSPQSKSYCFDSEPHFNYFGDYMKRPETIEALAKDGITETMSLQGSFFMMTRKKYWDMDVDDELYGSWGSQGCLVAMKTWLSGGRVLVNHSTWYAHMFRTQGQDFGFPYHQPGSGVQYAKKRAREIFFNNKWEQQIHPISWLIDKFWPVRGWTEEDRTKLKETEGPIMKKIPETVVEVGDKKLTKGICFYTDNQINLKIAHKVQKILRKIGLPIVSASLKPMDNMGKNIFLPLERGKVTMFKQQLAALEASDADIIFFCEHDVLYHKSHFDFVPEKHGVFYYNTNVWKVSWSDGHSLWVNNCIQVSGLCGYREDLIEHYRERVALAESGPWNGNWGYEPGTPGKTVFKTPFTQETWLSKYPNLDIRHNNNLTRNRWRREQWRDKTLCAGWTEKKVNEIEGWEDVVVGQ